MITLNPLWAGGFGAKPNLSAALVFQHDACKQNSIIIMIMYASHAMRGTVQSMRPGINERGRQSR
jgi:hypothetical protein